MRYLEKPEEAGRKATVPWEQIDPKIRDIVRLANSIDGVVTTQSCEGHVTPSEDGVGFHVRSAHVSMMMSESRMLDAIQVAPRAGIESLTFAFMTYDGSFEMTVWVEPSERGKLQEFFEMLKEVEGWPRHGVQVI